MLVGVWTLDYLCHSPTVKLDCGHTPTNVRQGRMFMFFFANPTRVREGVVPYCR